MKNVKKALFSNIIKNVKKGTNEREIVTYYNNSSYSILDRPTSSATNQTVKIFMCQRRKNIGVSDYSFYQRHVRKLQNLWRHWI